MNRTRTAPSPRTPVTAGRTWSFAAVTAAALALSACAGGAKGTYPSLAKRAVEGQATVAPPPPPPPPIANADASLQGQLDALVRRAQAADARFNALEGATDRAVAGAGARASETWFAAQVAVSRLDAARSDALTALGEVELLFTRRTVEGPTAGLNDIADARDRIVAIVARHNGRVRALTNRLR